MLFIIVKLALKKTFILASSFSRWICPLGYSKFGVKKRTVTTFDYKKLREKQLLFCLTRVCIKQIDRTYLLREKQLALCNCGGLMLKHIFTNIYNKSTF